MKRHESLIPLSREHHDGLILAQLIKKNAPSYKSMPQTLDEKLQYTKQFYKYDILHHFEKEEEMLQKIKDVNEALAAFANEIEQEHQQLRQLFKALDEPGDREEQLNQIGMLLEAHIRKEERELFPLIEKHCSAELMQELQPMLI